MYEVVDSYGIDTGVELNTGLLSLILTLYSMTGYWCPVPREDSFNVIYRIGCREHGVRKKTNFDQCGNK